MLSTPDDSSCALNTPDGSLFTPSEVVESFTDLNDRPSRAHTQVNSMERMNDFLSSKDISPVRYPLKIQWEEASKRTRRRYIRKTQQAVGAVLEEVAPNQSSKLWLSLVEYKAYGSFDRMLPECKHVENSAANPLNNG